MRPVDFVWGLPVPVTSTAPWKSEMAASVVHSGFAVKVRVNVAPVGGVLVVATRGFWVGVNDLDRVHRFHQAAAAVLGLRVDNGDCCDGTSCVDGCYL